MTTALMTKPATAIDAAPLRAADVRAQVNLIQEIMRDVMQGPEFDDKGKQIREGVHYGLVPGCGDKPTLLQPGAQKLILTFRFVPDSVSTVVPMERGHREVRTKVYLYQRGINGEEKGPLLGVGVGTCSTMEGKYRFRTGPVEFTEKPVPREYWDLRDKDPKKAKDLLNGGIAKKHPDTGAWVIARQGEKVEHDNPADYYNTVEKISFKRALVAAAINVTAAGDIFTQDIEDMPEVIQPPATQPAQAAPPSSNGNGASKPAAAPAQSKGQSVLDKMKKPEAPAAPPAQPKPAQEDGYQYDSEWLSKVMDCEDFLRGSQQGTATLNSIRAGFNLEKDSYPVFPDHQTEYLTTLQSAVRKLEKQ